MKKAWIVLVLLVFLTGCGVFDRGNYEKDRSGFVIRNDLIVKYHTNSIGEIDVFLIDRLFTFFEALEYTGFDVDGLDQDAVVSSIVTTQELQDCGIQASQDIPRFLRIGEKTYYYNIRDNGYCTYDEYTFDEDGFTDETVYEVADVSPIQGRNTTRFQDADFTINPFEDIVLIETIYFDELAEVWVKEIVSALPMSYTQAGNSIDVLSDTMEEIQILERYVLKNQSINLLVLREDYLDEEVNNIWSEETIDVLGRDHELIKKVRFKLAGEVLAIIEDTLSRLGLFQ